jgi:hypothetical protein
MSEHPTRFKVYRFQSCNINKEWFIYDYIASDPHFLDSTYETKAEAEAVCKLLNARDE